MTTVQPEGYLAMPSVPNGRAVLVLHAWWGLNDTIKAVCNRLADAGFVAFAADLYHGKLTDQISGAEQLAGALEQNVNQAKADLVKAVAFLKDTSGVASVAVLGFSLGAYYALDLSVNAADSVNTVVIFYGTGPADFSKSKAEYLGHFAEQDPYEPPSNLAYLEDALKQAGRPRTFYTYEGTGHWFFEPDRKDAFNAQAASLAWDRTLAFLKR